MKASFFSSLCLGTFSLGCWQTSRYFDKLELIELQNNILNSTQEQQQEEYNKIKDKRIVCRETLQGHFIHEGEIYLGPRGPPPGSLASDGPMSGRGGGGLSSSPQGFYVITPFVKKSGERVLINRGWVPKASFDACINNSINKNSSASSAASGGNVGWSKPHGAIIVDAISASFESGGYFSPPPLLATTRSKNNGNDGGDHGKTLLWLQEEAAVKLCGLELGSPKIYKEVVTTIEDSRTKNNNNNLSLPIRPNSSQAVEVKVSPEMHAGYAFTWFSLSGAGVVMTRNLLKKI